MRTLAKWHIWLGWLIGVPILIWLASGLFMVARPIEEVRGNHLRKEMPERTIPAGTQLIPMIGPEANVVEVTQRMDGDEAIAIFRFADGTRSRYSLTRSASLGEVLTSVDAERIVAERIVGGDRVVRTDAFPADEPPSDFRRPIAVWRIALEDGTHVYVSRDTGEIEAVRTRWWRAFDFMWGLHIMDLQTREDTSHPTLILFAAISLIGALMGFVLLFRRRKRRVPA